MKSHGLPHESDDSTVETLSRIVEFELSVLEATIKDENVLKCAAPRGPTIKKNNFMCVTMDWTVSHLIPAGYRQDYTFSQRWNAMSIDCHIVFVSGLATLWRFFINLVRPQSRTTLSTRFHWRHDEIEILRRMQCRKNIWRIKSGVMTILSQKGWQDRNVKSTLQHRLTDVDIAYSSSSEDRDSSPPLFVSSLALMFASWIVLNISNGHATKILGKNDWNRILTGVTSCLFVCMTDVS